jgi:exodeoxyribonuclease V gamma subunit
MNGRRDEAAEQRRLVAEGTLPPLALGASWHAALSREVAEVLARLEGYTPPVTVPVTLPGNGWRLTGRIDGVRGDRRLIVRAGNVRAEHRVRAWVEHVVMCAAREMGTTGLPGTTELFGKLSKGKYDVAEQIAPVGGASALLDALVDAVRQAQSSPLPFFVQSAWKWLDATHPKPAKKKKGSAAATPVADLAALGKQAAKAEFARVSHQFNPLPGDSEDPHVALCFRGTDPMEDRWADFERLARTLFDRWPSVGAVE